MSILPVLAQSPFAGTWRADLSQSQWPQKPFQYELANGTFKLLHSDPPVAVPADGRDHAVSGHPSYDSVNVRVIDEYTVEVIRKRAGKLYVNENFKVAPDHMSVADSFSIYPEAGKPGHVTATLRRIGKSVPGAHALSGAWIQENAESVSEHLISFTITDTPDGGVDVRAATGEHYQAKFDGKEYPYEGDPEIDTVVLKRPQPRVLEETLKRNGKIQRVTLMTVSEEGTTLTMDIHEHGGWQSKYVWKKQ
jgi:hypothetical protein